MSDNEIVEEVRARLEGDSRIPHPAEIVDLRDHYQDDKLRGAALQVLVSDPEVPADRIDVHVSTGWVTLKGEVKHQHESDVAFRDVSALPGVGGITNEIKVITAGIDG